MAAAGMLNQHPMFSGFSSAQDVGEYFDPSPLCAESNTPLTRFPTASERRCNDTLLGGTAPQRPIS